MVKSKRVRRKRRVKPTRADAEILLRLVELEQSERIIKALIWARSELGEISFEEFQREYPEGSDGYNYCMTIISFEETIGVLLHYNLINEDLLFDLFMVEHYWGRLQPIIYGMRETYKAPDIAENFEWLAKRAAKWRKEHERKV